jgi:hypothetical protein
MAIATLDDALEGFNAQGGLNYGWYKLQIAAEIAEAGGVPHNLCYTPGFPGASVQPSAAIGLNGETLTTRSGQFPFTNPVSGNTYLAKFECITNSTAAFTLILIDRLWHNFLTPGTNTTTATLQSITGMSTLPARDAVGSTGGYMILPAVEVYSTTGNGSAITNMSITYTNHLGTSGRSAGITSFPATAQKGTFSFFNLQAGDLGVRSIQAWTMGTSIVTGNIGLVLCRRLPMRVTAGTGMGTTGNLISLGAPRLYDNSVLEVLAIPGTTPAQTNFFGQLAFSQK